MTHKQFAIVTGLLLEQCELLREVRDLMLGAATTSTDDGCAHPEEHRISLASMGDPDHWVCKDCKFEHQGMRMN